MVATVSLPATAIALWLASSGFATLRNYRLVIEESEFVFTIPPAAERRIPWLSLEELKLEGVKFEGKGFVEMAEWKTLELKMVEGESIVLDVGRLSVEHRQILADLIIDRVKNARQGTKPLW